VDTTYQLKKIDFEILFISILLSFHIFFWDVKFYGGYGLRELIILAYFYLFYDFYKKSFLPIKRNIKDLSIILILFFLFSVHLTFNIFYEGLLIDFNNLKSISGIFCLIFFVYFYYDLILKNFSLVVNFFIFIFIFSILFSNFSESTITEIHSVCASKFKITNKFIFQENSHLGMMLGSVFCYLIYDNKSKKIYFHTFLFLILTLIFFFAGSVTQYVSIAIGLIIVAILDIKFFFRKIFLNLLLLISILYSINHYIGQYDKDYKNKCLNKFSKSSLSISTVIGNKILDKSKIDAPKTGGLTKDNFSLLPLVEPTEILLDPRNDEGDAVASANTVDGGVVFVRWDHLAKSWLIDKDLTADDVLRLPLLSTSSFIALEIPAQSLSNFEPNTIYQIFKKSRKSNEKKKFLDNIYNFENEKISKDIKYENLKRKYPKDLFNLTVSVYLNALNISFEALLHKPFGWGLNMYEYAFDLYMFDQRVYPYHYHEVFTLNYNDGSANIPKLITEFGLFSFILIPIFFIFLFSKKISPQNKIFFVTLILTQLLRGAGYFNGGFGFSIIFMCFTVFNFYNKKS